MICCASKTPADGKEEYTTYKSDEEMMIITVDDPSIDWERIGSQADTKKIFLLQDGTESVVGATSEEIKVVESGDGAALQRAQILDSVALGNRKCATVMLRSSFKPISHIDQDGDRTISIKYDGLNISGACELADGTVKPIQVKLSEPVFDAHSVEMILRALPLREGYAARLQVYSAAAGQVMWVSLQVSGKETTPAGAGKETDAWIVEADYGDTKLTYWIGAQTPELLKQSIVIAEGTVIQFVR
jgi:hypothetical protein